MMRTVDEGRAHPVLMWLGIRDFRHDHVFISLWALARFAW